MTIPEELAQAKIEMDERIAANTVKGDLQRARTMMQEVDGKIQAVVDKYGSFDTLPVNTKQAYIAAWQVVKDAKDAFEAATIKELLDWRP